MMLMCAGDAADDDVDVFAGDAADDGQLGAR